MHRPTAGGRDSQNKATARRDRTHGISARGCAGGCAGASRRREHTGVQPELAGRRVLVVDDNATNRRVLAVQATKWGMEASATGSPAEALAWLDDASRGRTPMRFFFNVSVAPPPASTPTADARAATAAPGPSEAPAAFAPSVPLPRPATRGWHAEPRSAAHLPALASNSTES